MFGKLMPLLLANVRYDSVHSSLIDDIYPVMAADAGTVAAIRWMQSVIVKSFVERSIVGADERVGRDVEDSIHPSGVAQDLREPFP